MKAITLWQPWATLMAIGAKRIETRSWSSAYTGPLAIHAAKGFPSPHDEVEARELAAQEPFLSSLRVFGYDNFDELPRGAIVGVCALLRAVPTDKVRDSLTELERAFGHFAPRRFAWLTDDMRQIHPPIYCSGKQGLWDPPPGLVDMLRKRLAP